MHNEKMILSPQDLERLILRRAISDQVLDDVRFALRQYSILDLPVKIIKHVHANGEITVGVYPEREKHPPHDMPTNPRIWEDAVDSAVLAKTA